MQLQKENTKGEERQIVVFKIGKEEFGVNINEVREIIRMEQITTIPNAVAFVRGVINLRGGIIVVIDLSMKLGLHAKEMDKNTRIIVIEFAGNTIGMIVDSATEVIRLNNENVKPAPEIITKKINTSYITGVGILGERLLILLDLGEVLRSDEITVVKDIEQSLSDLREKQKEVNSSNEKKENVDTLNQGKKNNTKPVKDVAGDMHFKTHDGKTLRNVHELSDYIKSLNEDTFKSFVNEEKNDFYEWIKNAVGDDDLADKIKEIRSKEEVSKEIMNRVLAIS